MTATGISDIAVGLFTLLCPVRAILLYMAFWGLMTACLRPLTGESIFELVERGANYGMPLAFLLLCGSGRLSWSVRDWFKRAYPPAALNENLARHAAWIMQGSIALLLIGHGGLGIWAHKKEWVEFFAYFGITEAAVTLWHLSQWVGWFEILIGLLVLIRPRRELLLFVLVWKLATELLRPLVGQPLFQFIERGGDYALPFALLWLRGFLSTFPTRRVKATGRTFSTIESVS